MLFAAWLTTAAFEDARCRFNGGPLSISLDAWDHGQIYDKSIAPLRVAVNENDQRGLLTLDILPFFIHGLVTPWKSILDSQGRTYTEKELVESVRQKPAHYVTVVRISPNKNLLFQPIFDLQDMIRAEETLDRPSSCVNARVFILKK